jgi:hypothetical protein
MGTPLGELGANFAGDIVRGWDILLVLVGVNGDDDFLSLRFYMIIGVICLFLYWSLGPTIILTLPWCF